MIKLFKNQILIYFLIRYSVYFLQFIISILIAVKLGTYYFGLWSFLLLIMSYFQIVDFGIPNSISVLLVQNKNKENETKNIIKTSFYLMTVLIGAIILIASYYFIFGISYFEKYQVGYYFYILCFIISFGYFNKLFMSIYRVKNRLNEISFFQAIIQILVFISIFLAKEKQLLNLIIGSYLIGNILSFVVFKYSKDFFSKKGIFKKDIAKVIINKGWYLFIYNICFYFLAITVRTVVSVFYSVEDFAFFSFSYTMANAIILLLEAMGFVVFPKMIDKLKSKDIKEVKRLIHSIKQQYITLAYGLIYFALILFPVLLGFIPKYEEALNSLSLIALIIVMYINAFGYNTYLIANNFEKLISKVLLVILIVNLVLAVGISYLFQSNYSYTIFSLLISYTIYSITLIYYGNQKMGTPKTVFRCFIEGYPLRLLIPHSIAFIIVLKNVNNHIPLTMLPFIIFLILNKKSLKSIASVFLKILKSPSVINV
ncbi:oligosaccharide flippase family protein [Tenacibaculum ascidiaceicola]|uniref:oligosaccharide flippase family protein n=1 Tax=Tenacibaculum ascidiaceicola TaxID=1699411 RepID=UPI0039ED7436